MTVRRFAAAIACAVALVSSGGAIAQARTSATYNSELAGARQSNGTYRFSAVAFNHGNDIDRSVSLYGSFSVGKHYITLHLKKGVKLDYATCQYVGRVGGKSWNGKTIAIRKAGRWLQYLQVYVYRPHGS